MNSENLPATVDLMAYADDGTQVAAVTLNLAAHAKVVNTPDAIFAGLNLYGATYIASQLSGYM